MSPNKIQRVVQMAQQIMAGSQGGGADIAQELSELFRQARSRLAQVANLISRGESGQAQDLAERSPPLVEVVQILGFGKLREWNSRCEREGWTPAGDLDRRHILLLQECFQAEGPKSPEMVDHIRGRILRGDRGGAIQALKVFLRQHPGDQWGGEELKKLMAAEAASRCQQMAKLLGQGEMTRLAEAHLEFEAMGLEPSTGTDLGPVLRSVEAFRRARLEEELVRAAEKLEEWKRRGSWREAGEYGDQLRAEAAALGIKLGTRGNLTSLLKWADDCRDEDERKVRVAQAEKDVELFLDTFEQARGSRIPLKRGEVSQALAQLRAFRRLAEDLRHGWSERVEGKRARVEKVLLAKEKAEVLRQRLLLVTLLGVVTVALATGGSLTYLRLRENKEMEQVARMIERCRAEKTISEIENYLEGLPPAEPGDSTVTRQNRARLMAEVARAASQQKGLEKQISVLEERLSREPRSWREEKEAFVKIQVELQELMAEHRKEWEEKKATLEKGWLAKASAEREKNTMRLQALEKDIREELENIKVQFDVAVLRLELKRDEITDLQQELALWPPEIRPSEAFTGNLAELKVQIDRKLVVAKELQGLRLELEESSRKKDEKKYLAALERLAAQPEIPAEERASIKAVLAWAEGRERWKQLLWAPREPAVAENRSILPLTLAPAGEVLPKEAEMAGEILEVAGLEGAVYLYNLPEEKSRKLRKEFSQGTIDQTYQNPRGELFARKCSLWNESKGEFTMRSNIFLSASNIPPHAEEEPLSRLFSESKMRAFCERLKDGGIPAGRISAVMIADRILRADQAPASGKIFLLQKLHELCSLRPETHDLRFLPWMREILAVAGEASAIGENVWLSSTEDASDKPLWSKLASANRPNAEAQAAFLQTVAAGGEKAEIAFVGHIGTDGLFPVDEETRVVHLVPPGQAGGDLQLIYGKRDGLRPFTPVYRLKMDPSLIVREATKKSGIDEATAEGLVREYLPTVSALLHPSR